MHMFLFLCSCVYSVRERRHSPLCATFASIGMFFLLLHSFLYTSLVQTSKFEPFFLNACAGCYHRCCCRRMLPSFSFLRYHSVSHICGTKSIKVRVHLSLSMC
ncbi:hypothetical protein, unlikely [Trypanosoma brucei gambiense DAL972]|uniref:Uncharacterized protein n=1 Tax=Trypanosoma brucei gambiense (strain MHOM/CI/86/DAL972) TaxID=679716 RepID=C9ZZX7_TRYB9|nr:hypothetical protein, unlikely [Trypanosoma brucei gambiense DAL972]CBH16535.1 hypothetical protein, unlikely [Trypanosoma brucei gambiense DAL972]|eukprot:XP_011778799.1 hypothetical protein, unlikely [Trypanosoma brucei gambiense DAL972]